eukprot:82592-Ditylum_brightwellii.AAC.1
MSVCLSLQPPTKSLPQHCPQYLSIVPLQYSPDISEFLGHPVVTSFSVQISSLTTMTPLFVVFQQESANIHPYTGPLVVVPYDQDLLLITILGIIQEAPAGFGINGKCKNVGIYALDVYQCKLLFTGVRVWTRVQFPWMNLSSVLSFELAKYICLPIRCKPLDLVHNAQYKTVQLGNRKSCICSLEPSWVAVRYTGGLGRKGGR